MALHGSVLKARKGTLVQLEPLALLVQLERKVFRASKVIQALLVHKVFKEYRALLEPLEQLALLALCNLMQ
jgi:hypothetical protein